MQIMSMNQEIKARWTAALRSGEYVQGTGYLRTEDGYCCLGVLCDLAVKDGIITETAPSEFQEGWYYGPGQEEFVLPPAVMTWAGLSEVNPHFSPEGFPLEWAINPHFSPEGFPLEWAINPTEDGHVLSNANDGGTPFSVIADIIDAQF